MLPKFTKYDFKPQPPLTIINFNLHPQVLSQLHQPAPLHQNLNFPSSLKYHGGRKADQKYLHQHTVIYKFFGTRSPRKIKRKSLEILKRNLSSLKRLFTEDYRNCTTKG